MTAKPVSIKVAGCKSGGCARKAVELTSGDLAVRRGFTTEDEAIHLIKRQKSAEGIVAILLKESEGPNGPPQGG